MQETVFSGKSDDRLKKSNLNFTIGVLVLDPLCEGVLRARNYLISIGDVLMMPEIVNGVKLTTGT